MAIAAILGLNLNHASNDYGVKENSTLVVAVNADGTVVGTFKKIAKKVSNLISGLLGSNKDEDKYYKKISVYAKDVTEYRVVSVKAEVKGYVIGAIVVGEIPIGVTVETTYVSKDGYEEKCIKSPYGTLDECTDAAWQQCLSTGCPEEGFIGLKPNSKVS